MAVVTDFAFVSTDNITLTDSGWQSLIGGGTNVVGADSVVTLTGYVLDLADSVGTVRFVVNGVEVVQGSPEDVLVYMLELETGVNYLIDFQADVTNHETVTAGARGFTIVDMGYDLPD